MRDNLDRGPGKIRGSHTIGWHKGRRRARRACRRPCPSPISPPLRILMPSPRGRRGIHSSLSCSQMTIPWSSLGLGHGSIGGTHMVAAIYKSVQIYKATGASANAWASAVCLSARRFPFRRALPMRATTPPPLPLYIVRSALRDPPRFSFWATALKVLAL